MNTYLNLEKASIESLYSDEYPLVTIITATFNSEKYLEATIKSIENQSYPNIEYIIIDGGSTDRTIDLIKRNRKTISSYISEPDKGVYDAWNKGINLAKGVWISFIGDDDLIHPEAVNRYIQFIRNNPDCQYVSSRARYVTKDLKELMIFGEVWKWPKFSRIMKVAHVGSFHRQDLFEQYGIYNIQYKIVGDYELLLRPRQTLKAGFMNFITVTMRTGGVSYSVNAIYESFKGRTKTGGRKLVPALFDFFLQIIAFYYSRLRILFR